MTNVLDMELFILSLLYMYVLHSRLSRLSHASFRRERQYSSIMCGVLKRLATVYVTLDRRRELVNTNGTRERRNSQDLPDDF